MEVDHERKLKKEFSSSESLLCNDNIRFIKKSGHINVSHTNLKRKSMLFIKDIFTTGVDLPWRWNLFLFALAFLLSWLGFACFYWLISYVSGDFDPELPSLVNGTIEIIKHQPCIHNLDIDSQFASVFLFSLETQTTIGYGGRFVTEKCPFSIILVVIQSVFGCVIDAFMIGLIMAKIMRPKKRAETLLYSKNAVINIRNGVLCLMFRVGNLRKSHLVEACIKMQLLRSRTTREGEFIPLEQIDLELDLNGDSDRLFLVTPQTICHKINEDSPLWDLSAMDLGSSDFEIIVLLEGMVEATGMLTQARASYLPSEIMWGHRFHNVISYQKKRGYKVNFKDFHHTFFTSECPLHSAKKIQELNDANDLDLKKEAEFSVGSSANDVRSTSTSSLDNSTSDVSIYDGQSLSYV